jgi:DNA-binding SARP family transcriptional activator
VGRDAAACRRGATIRNYVKRLRQALGDTEHGRIRTQPPGYLIAVRADELDVSRFERC